MYNNIVESLRDSEFLLTMANEVLYIFHLNYAGNCGNSLTYVIYEHNLIIHAA